MSKKDSALTSSQVADLAIQRVRADLEGAPTPEQEALLHRDEIDQPVNDTDFFDFVDMAYIRKGVPIEFVVKKNGNLKGVLEPPMDWLKLRKIYGPGSFTVIAKDKVKKVYVKSRTEYIDADGTTVSDVASEAAAPSFQIGPPPSPSSSNDALYAMLERQDARAQDARAEDRRLQDDRRREAEIREEKREAAARESRKETMTLLTGLGTALGPKLMEMLAPKRDDTALDFYKEQMKAQNEKFDRMMERLLTPPKNEMDSLKLIGMLQEAEDRGWKKREKISEEIDEKAEIRAEEMTASKGDGENESTLGTVLKSMLPGISALLARGAQAPAAALAAQPPVEVVSEAASPATPPAAAAAPAAPAEPSPVDRTRASVLEILGPFFMEQLTRINSGANIRPDAAARESLDLLKSKGFSQKRVIQLFPEDVFRQVIKQSGIPENFHSWFNEYYAALAQEKRAESPLRARTGTRGAATVSSIRPAAASAPASAPPKQHDAGVAERVAGSPAATPTVLPPEELKASDAGLGPTPSTG
jgi:hypothetical protein